MLLKRLIFNNYKTYYGYQELNLYIPEDDRKSQNKNIILIGGLNGAGKTTILKAILYVLFGKRQMKEEEYNRLFSNVINNQFFDEGGRDCSVTLNIETDRKEDWEIKVGWSFDNYKRVINENRNLIVRKPGVKHGQSVKIDNIEVYNRFIDKIIPYYAAPFFIFDGEEIKDIILRQNSYEMKEAIQKITGMNSYKDLLNDLNAIKSTLELEISKLSKSKEIYTLQTLLKKEEAKLNEYQEKMDHIRTSLKEQNERAQTVKDKRDEKLKLNMHSRDKLIKERTELEIKVKNKQQNFLNIYQENSLQILLENKIKNLIEKLRLEKQQQDSRLVLASSLKPYHTFINKLLTKEITPALTEQQLEQIKEIGQNVWIDEKQINKVTIQTEEYHDISPKDYSALLSWQNKNNNDFANSINELERMEQQLSKLTLDISYAPEAADISTESRLLEEHLKKAGELELRFKAIKSKYRAASEATQSLNSKIENTVKRTSNFDDIQGMYNNVLSVINVVEDFIAESTKLKTNFIKTEFSHMLVKLFRKQGEFGKIDFDTDTYTVRLYNDRDQEISIHDRSAGEMQMISSALIWALTKASDLNMPMVIDTPLGRLDSVHRNHLINHYYKELSEQVIILSTDTEITKEYIELMESNSYKQFMLDYNEQKKYTILRDGYFDLVRK